MKILALLIAQSLGWGQTFWGMSPQSTHEIYPESFPVPLEQTICYNADQPQRPNCQGITQQTIPDRTIGRRNYDINLIFTDEQLSKVHIYRESSEAYSIYAELKLLLTDKYGNPTINNTLASIGVQSAIWNTENTLVKLTIITPDKVYLIYLPKQDEINL